MICEEKVLGEKLEYFWQMAKFDMRSVAQSRERISPLQKKQPHTQKQISFFGGGGSLHL
jgi:hypothetical protein